MEDHGYTTRRYAPQENSYGAWNARNNGFETHSDGRGKTGYAINGEANYPRDHVCRPVIIDAQGRRRPLIAYTPENKMDNYVTKTETIIEQVHQPDEGTRYGNISPRKVAPLKEYGVLNNGWTRRYAPQENSFDAWNARNNGFETHSDGREKTGYASNGEANYPQDHVCRPVIIDAQGRRRPLIAYTPGNKMDNYVTKTETIIEQVHQPDEGTRYGNFSPRKVAPLKEYGVMNNGWSTPVIPDRPHRVEEFISQVQTDASRPSRSGLLSSTHWRQKFNPNGHGHGGIFSRGKNGDQPHHEGRTEMTVTSEYKEEPALITEGGWARPNRAAWSAHVPLTNPTNDI